MTGCLSGFCGVSIFAAGKTRTETRIIRRMKTMSNEKKYTREEIRAIADEEIRRMKENGELNPDEMAGISGGNDYISNNKLVTYNGEVLSAETIRRDTAIAREIAKTYNKDVARVFLEEAGYSVGAYKDLDEAIEELLRRVSRKYGGY